VLSLVLYRFAFIEGNLGLAFTVGVVFLLLVLAFILLFIRFYQDLEGEQV
jgi:ABC-type sugar transport system permease subunit